jgi:hypothetical protein
MLFDTVGLDAAGRVKAIESVCAEEGREGLVRSSVGRGGREEFIQAVKPYYLAYAAGRKEVRSCRPRRGMPTTHVKLAADARVMFKPNYPPARS